jgi:signal transduction histidine kinase
LVSTRREAEKVLVVGILGIRAIDFVQAIIGISSGALTHSPNPGLNLACLGVAGLESVAVGTWLYRRGTVQIDRRPVLIDTCMAALALAAVPFDTAPADRLASWSIWAFSFTLSTAALLGGHARTLAGSLAWSGALGSLYFAVVALPSWNQRAFVASTAANAAAYMSFTAVAWLFARIIRDLADLADQSRQRVAELERERSQATVHDLLPFLHPEHLLDADESTRKAMIEQTEAKYRKMRDFVDGRDQQEDLESCLRGVMELHLQLSCRAVFDLDTRTAVSPEVLERLVHAVDTALANVEQNAPGAAVVVHAESDPTAVRVTVHDDGPGFDPAQVAPGFGIGHILGHHLDDIGGHGQVTSAPGKGTEVTITVPRQEEPR